jgi:hypothetical protein
MLVAMALVAAAVADPASPAAKSGAEPGFFCDYKKIEEPVHDRPRGRGGQIRLRGCLDRAVRRSAIWASPGTTISEQRIFFI